MARVTIEASKLIAPSLVLSQVLEKKKAVLKDIASSEGFTDAKNAYDRITDSVRYNGSPEVKFIVNFIPALLDACLLFYSVCFGIVDGIKLASNNTGEGTTAILLGLIGVLASAFVIVYVLLSDKRYKKDIATISKFENEYNDKIEKNCLCDVLRFDGTDEKVRECVDCIDSFECFPMMQLLSKTKGVSYEFSYDVDNGYASDTLTATLNGETLCVLSLGKYSAHEIASVTREKGTLDFSFLDAYV